MTEILLCLLPLAPFVIGFIFDNGVPSHRRVKR